MTLSFRENSGIRFGAKAAMSLIPDVGANEDEDDGGEDDEADDADDDAEGDETAEVYAVVEIEQRCFGRDAAIRSGVNLRRQAKGW